MKQRIILLIILSIIPAYLALQVYTPVKANTNPKVIISKSPLSLENVYAALILNDVKHPEVVMRQIIVETMWLRCENCSKEYNNLFGFYLNGDYIKFENWYESVQYYKTWQDQYYKEGDYYQFLARIGYATSEKYIQTLKGVILPEFNS